MWPRTVLPPSSSRAKRLAFLLPCKRARRPTTCEIQSFISGEAWVYLLLLYRYLFIYLFILHRSDFRMMTKKYMCIFCTVRIFAWRQKSFFFLRFFFAKICDNFFRAVTRQFIFLFFFFFFIWETSKCAKTTISSSTKYSPDRVMELWSSTFSRGTVSWVDGIVFLWCLSARASINFYTNLQYVASWGYFEELLETRRGTGGEMV